MNRTATAPFHYGTGSMRVTTRREGLYLFSKAEKLMRPVSASRQQNAEVYWQD
jgi:hypothetical protein